MSIREAIRNAGVQRTLQEMIDWVDEVNPHNEDSLYLFILKCDLEIALKRYKQRYIFEDDHEC